MNGALREATRRLFALQAAWNYDRLQGVGFAWALEPLVRPVREGDPERYRQILGRAAAYFNTNPFVAGLAVGAVAKTEVNGTDVAKVERLRTAIKGPLGALGDRLMWAGVLPAASAIGVIVAVTADPWLGGAVFLLVFNIPHLILRFWGIREGWRRGPTVAMAMNQYVLQHALKVVGPAAVAGLGIATPVAIDFMMSRVGALAWWPVMGMAGVTTVVSLWLAPSIGGARLGAVALILVLATGLLWT